MFYIIIPKSTSFRISEFQSQLVEFRISKSTDLIAHCVIPKSTS